MEASEEYIRRIVREELAKLGFTKLSEEISRLIREVSNLVTRISSLEDELREIPRTNATLQELVKKNSEIIEQNARMILESREEARKLFEKLEARIEQNAELIKQNAQKIEQNAELIRKLEARIEQNAELIKQNAQKIEQMDKKLDFTRAELLILAGRWGPDLEELVRKIMRDKVLEAKKVDIERAEKLIFRDDECLYRPFPSDVDVDILMTDSQVWLVEVKGRGDSSEVVELYNKARAYESKYGKKPDRILLVCIHATKRGLSTAERLGIEVVYARILDGLFE